MHKLDSVILLSTSRFSIRNILMCEQGTGFKQSNESLILLFPLADSSDISVLAKNYISELPHDLDYEKRYY